MAGSNPAERGVSPQSEIRLFEDVSFEEIAERTGGQLSFTEGKPWSIDYAELSVAISSDRHGESNSLYISTSDSDGEYSLDGTGVILREESVTFVDPFDSRRRRDKILSFITISREEGITLARKRMTTISDMGIIKAAKLAAEAEERRVKKIKEFWDNRSSPPATS